MAAAMARENNNAPEASTKRFMVSPFSTFESNKQELITRGPWPVSFVKVIVKKKLTY